MREGGDMRTRSQIDRARGGARTMKPRWLWAIILLALTTGINAWRPQTNQHFTYNQDQIRHRRQTSKNNSTRQIQVINWKLQLEENTAIKSPFYGGCSFFKGVVIGEEGSTVSVTECEGQLYGLLQVGSEEYTVQPTLKKRDHVLKKRDVIVSEQPAEYDLTGDTVNDLELDFEEDEPAPAMHILRKHRDHDIEYFRNVFPVTKPLKGVKGLWLEIAIVADHTMLKFHGKERVKFYILALMNIVSAIFNDPSLSSNMTLVINKLYLYEERDPVLRNGNVKKSLEAVNKWNYRHLKKLPSGSSGWDAAVWLTRSQLGGPSGFAPVGGVCSHTRSAAINRDEGLTSAFVIAHELAHLLGLTHDGDGLCEEAARQGSVMAPTVLATLHNYAWSTCSKKQFHEKSRNWWCLHERSKDDGVVLGGAKELSTYMFTMDEQCRTEFGDGYTVCKTVKVRSTCSKLWCADRRIPHVCRSKRAPPLEGTPCGHNHWCVDQECEPMPGQDSINRTVTEENEKHLPVEDRYKPEWGEWGEWSECSASCGYGLRTRMRHCRRGGTLSEGMCEGAGFQVTTCWTRVVCSSNRDMRVDLCHRHASHLMPFIHQDESKQCEIWCTKYEGGDASAFGALPDGTPCSYERPYDLCFQGTCVRGQCNSTDPTCNWCPDGYCSNYTHVFHRQLGKGWVRMAVIPHDAHEMSIHISTPLPLHVALKERREKHIVELSNHNYQKFELQHPQDGYLKYDPSAPQNLQIIDVDSNVITVKEGREGWRGVAVVAGTILEWNQTESDVYIIAKSQLHTDLMIMAIPEQELVSDESISVQVSVNYSTPAVRARPLEYRVTERGPCSVSCGGGIRAVHPRCNSRERCHTRYERCNIHRCEFTWMAGEWEECSATCGDLGVQERQVYCVPNNITLSSRREVVVNSVTPAVCTSDPPVKQQPCNRIQCPVYWQELSWTPCSTTCGRGVSRRPLHCPAVDETLCGARPRERYKRCRVRRCPPSATPNHDVTCPPADATHYCELFSTDELQRNCVIPPFNKYCCNACKTVRSNYNHV